MYNVNMWIGIVAAPTRKTEPGRYARKRLKIMIAVPFVRLSS